MKKLLASLSLTTLILASCGTEISQDSKTKVNSVNQFCNSAFYVGYSNYDKDAGDRLFYPNKLVQELKAKGYRNVIFADRSLRNVDNSFQIDLIAENESSGGLGPIPSLKISCETTVKAFHREKVLTISLENDGFRFPGALVKMCRSTFEHTVNAIPNCIDMYDRFYK